MAARAPDQATGSGNVQKGTGSTASFLAPLLICCTVPHALISRYDARLLLHALPEIPSTETSAASTEPISPRGWSDLPSDAEDTFFLSPEEVED